MPFDVWEVKIAKKEQWIRWKSTNNNVDRIMQFVHESRGRRWRTVAHTYDYFEMTERY